MNKDEIKKNIIDEELLSWTCSKSDAPEIENILEQLKDEKVILPFMKRHYSDEVLFSWE